MNNKSSCLWKYLKLFGMFFLLISIIVASLGCASIVSKSNWPIYVRSTPEQADVTITDVKEGKKIFQGKTPTTLTLSFGFKY